MSFILDALKKSEQNNQRQTLPGLQTQHQNNTDTKKKPISWLWLLLVILFFNGAFLLTFTLFTKQKEDSVSKQTSIVTLPDSPVFAVESEKTSSNNSTEIIKTKSNSGHIQDQIPDNKTIETDDNLSVSSSIDSSVEGVEEIPENDNKENIRSVNTSSESTLEQQENTFYSELESGSNIGEIANENSSDSGLLPSNKISSMDIDEFPEQTVQNEPEKKVNLILPDYDQLPSVIKKNIPSISISFHAYSQKRSSRIVSINGRIMREGQEISSGLKLDEITTDGIILNYKGNRFKMKVF